MKKKNKVIALALATAMVIPIVLTGCGSGGGGAGTDNTFTWWIYSGADASYYSEYQENPAVQYTLSKTWGEDNKKVGFEFWQPAAGQEQNNYSTMIASGDLPDIIDAVICDPPQVMHEKGYALDITEYVEKYMPNYVELVHSGDEILKNAVIVEDGKEHYYGLMNVADKTESVFQGYQYRRDWIVKYGKNPVTGAAFTGGYTDPDDYDSWEDDVVFPSGETYPLYISDWEWMFEIFETAMDDLGIDDSYCMSLYYPGFTWSGGLLSCFGGGVCMWYQDRDKKVQFGGDKEPFRAYLECMNSWYEKGWLDQAFNERTSDAFYSIDDTSVRQGKVGMFNGQQSQLGGRMDMKDGGFTEGIYVAAAPYPINDIYGDESCKYVEPDCVFGGGLVSGGVIITPAAEQKDLAALCSYLDYFYSEEGALIKTLGLNADQAAEFTDSTFYNDNNLGNGTYQIGEDGKYIKDQVIVNDGGSLIGAAAFTKAPGIILVENVDLGLADSYQESLDMWSKYPNTGIFMGSITTAMMTAEDTKICADTQSKVLEFQTNNAVDFITGKKDISAGSTDWENWCKSLQKFNYQKVNDVYQLYVDQYPFR